MIRCRFCSATYQNWSRTKGGRARSGFELLANHVLLAHEVEYDRIQNQLNVDMQRHEVNRE